MILFLPGTVKERNNKIFNTLPLFFALCAACFAAQAQVYKWVDESGKTHYGERPPQGAAAKTVEQRLANPAPAPGKSGEPDWKGKELEFRSRRIAAEQAETKQRQQEEQARRDCNQARDTLAQMKAARRIYHLDEKGARIYQSDAEREAGLARQETLVAQRCP